MSNKETCPACESMTSNIASAFRRGEPCPYCGLPADSAAAVIAAQERGADALLVRQAAEAERRAGVAEAEVDRLRGLLCRVRDVLEDEAEPRKVLYRDRLVAP
jgi:hypothetical protein